MTSQSTGWGWGLLDHLPSNVTLAMVIGLPNAADRNRRKRQARTREEIQCPNMRARIVAMAARIVQSMFMCLL